MTFNAFRCSGQTAVALPLLLVSAMACRGTQDSDSIATTRPIISDQAHDQGTEGFFFLPPLVPRPGNFGEQVLGLWPTVVIDQMFDSQTFQSFATFTQTDGPSGEHLRRHFAGGPAVDDDGDTDPDGYFVARWKTRDLDIPPGTTFRISVLAGGRRLGLADVQVVGSRKEIKSLDSNEIVGLLADHTLRIKFRIGRVAVDRDGDGAFDWVDNCPTIPNPEQADTVGNGIGDACRCAASADACPSSPRLYALMSGLLEDPTPTAIEVVVLATRARIHSIDLGTRSVTSLEVSPDGSRAYVADRYNGEIAVYHTVTRAQLAAIPIPFVSETAISSDGATLFAIGAPGLVAIDTATNQIVAQHAYDELGPSALSIAVSPDGSRIGVTTTAGGSSPTYELFDSGLNLLASIPIVGSVEGCDAFPIPSAFRSNELALLWDPNCDSLYQVDLQSGTQLVGSTINTGRDSGTSLGASNAFVYLPSSGRAMVIKESLELVSIDPTAGTFSTAATFAAWPFVASTSPGAQTVFVSEINRFQDAGADSLDAIGAGTSGRAHSIYTFADGDKFVRELRVVP